MRNVEPYWQVNCDKKDRHFSLTVDHSPQQEGLSVEGQSPACQQVRDGWEVAGSGGPKMNACQQVVGHSLCEQTD